MHQNKNFFAKLLDFSFSSFITPQVVGVLYGLGLLFATLLTLTNVLRAFSFDFVTGLGALVISVIGLLVYAIGFRVFLEGFVALIRTAESTRILAENVLNTTPNDNLNP